MGIGTEIRDRHGFGEYLRESILPLSPAIEPVAFRGAMQDDEEPGSFFEEMECGLMSKPGAVWNVLGTSGLGKTHLARWAAGRWGRRFLEDPEGSPVPLWVDAGKLEAALEGKGLASALPGQDQIESLIEKHPFIAILDRGPASTRAAVTLAAGRSSSLRILHLASGTPLPGPAVTLAPWDRESALLAAQRRLGAEGVRRVQAVEASPAAALLGYPRFVSHLLERRELEHRELETEGGAREFLLSLFDSFGGGAAGFPAWCEGVYLATGRSHQFAEPARRLHLSPPGLETAISEFARVFRVFILAELIRSGRERAALPVLPLEREELDLIARLLGPMAETIDLKLWTSHGGVSAANRINLDWRLHRRPFASAVFHDCPGPLFLPGVRFEGEVAGLRLVDSDLSGLAPDTPRLRRCRFVRCRLASARLSGTTLTDCDFKACDLHSADLSDAGLGRCEFVDLDLSRTVLAGSIFMECTFTGVTLGMAAPAGEALFRQCRLTNCKMAGLASAGLHLERSSLDRLSLAALEPSVLDAEKASFRRCDLIELAAPRARLAGASFEDCLLAGVSLEGADLREASFRKCDFQPGPASRAGLTEGSTRVHPMHGSQSGYYGGEMLEGVWGDPEMLRTADLRGADLRGASFEHTDLFRVDLRGAKMDPELLKQARKMGAFIETGEPGGSPADP